MTGQDPFHLRMVYFAWVRERIGHSEEVLTPPSNIKTIRDLLTWATGKSAGHALALSDLRAIRIAINQDHAGLDDPIHSGDEIALFPPVSGG
jgi:molybdopterin synthase sulfur carrier subunit